MVFFRDVEHDVAPSFNPIPPETAPTPSEPVNWTLWISVGMVLIAFLLLAVIGLVVVRTRHKILDRQAAAHSREQDWKAATTLFNQARDGLADPYAIFIRPLLDDNTVDTTAAFIFSSRDRRRSVCHQGSAVPGPGRRPSVLLHRQL